MSDEFIRAAIDIGIDQGLREFIQLIDDMKEDWALEDAELAGPVFDPPSVVLRNDVC